ncbi:MAG TPA: translation initiation factor IF-2 [Candidatus Acidoferrales bacterium]|nr:translation initiation factor IF-2 [Candidatus Acidoferrales bacterium]
MPVRVYDIAKKLGLENKEILAKAKEMGIAAAKVPSSSLDKITAEWLEEEIIKTMPAVAARLAPKPVEEKPVPPPPPEPIVIIHSPPPAAPPPAPALEVEVKTVEPVAEAKVEAPAPPAPAPMPAPAAAPMVAAAPPAAPVAPVAPPKPVAPPPPPAPPKPQIGELVGRIQLPVRPVSRSGERERGGERGGQRTQPGGRASQPARGDQRGEGRQGGQRGRDGRPVPGAAPAKPATPQQPKIVLPSDAQVITIKPPIIVRALAEAMKQKPFAIIAELMKLRVMATVNQSIDEKIAAQVAANFGYRFEAEKRAKGEGLIHQQERKVELDVDDKVEDLKPRAPVVTIMGHVDHGKTSLLDVIRKANVAAGEAGGITQHIGAYTIGVPHPERKGELAQITFLDTPGHAAFSSMRARGANVTDIVVLVVAANDGVMPQTLEALAHAKAAKVPILVAINKCDHPNANPLKVRQQLQEKGLVPDDWGGDTIYVECSALTKQGIDKLLEMILLQADLLELKANPNRNAKGNVIESGVSAGGPTATVLVRKGTLHVSDVVICGEFYGKVRALINEEGQRLKEAGPSVAVSVLGLNGVPEAGWEFSSVDDEKAARALAEERAEVAKNQDLENRSKVTLENLFASLEAAQSKVLRVVVKADTQGSVEAIVEALKKIESDKVSLEVLHSDVGTITENDVALASASKAVILGFHTRVDSTAAEKSKHAGVQIKLYAIIYELIDEVKAAMAGLLDPVLKETVVGSAEVRQIFELSKGVPVAGCAVTSGRVARGKVRVRRRKDVIYEGVTQSLRRFQDEVNEVRAGMECGIRIEGFGEIQVGDVIECYTIEKVAAKL